MHYDEDDERPFLPSKKEKKWDQFPDSPREVISDSMVESQWYNVSLKILHLLAFTLTFIIVLFSATVSKGSLLFMTSQVSHNQTKPYCNEELDVNRQFVVKLPDTERIAWIWMLFYAYCVPQVGTFIRAVRICIFKKREPHQWSDFFLVMATETFPSIGAAILVFGVLPQLDVLKGAMLLNGFCFFPALINVVMIKKCSSVTRPPKIFLDIVALACQSTALVVWPLVQGTAESWLIPIAILCITIGYWENFFNWKMIISKDDVRSGKNDMFLRAQRNIWVGLARERVEFTNTRYFIYAFVSLWKIIVFFVTMVLYFLISEGQADFLFDYYSLAMHSHPIVIQEIAPVITSNLANIDDIIATGLGTSIPSDQWTPVYVFLVNVLSTYVTYIFGKFACKILIQGFSYAFPINLTMPFAISILIAMCGEFAHDPCAYSGTIPPYLFFDIPSNMYFLERFIVDEWAWMWLLWMLSQAWITRHIWTACSIRLARTEVLYLRPMYDAFLIDQDIALNRRKEIFRSDEGIADEGDGDDVSKNEERLRSFTDGFEDGPVETTRIYACGTMWHETKDEMMAFLKSILHLDADQCSRKIANVELGIEKDYYELETNVFFDDAFVRYHKNPEPYLNDYVKLLIGAMDDARRDVHEVEVQFPGPVKTSTPYGGRLTWTLPGGTKFIAHLKDKKKIRAKKRWSQVMYMYYLLGHRLINGNVKGDKDVRGSNTFILALDGDIDFQPDAVLLLVDLMKKSRSVGAACGRIHPIGSGPMVWYQIFEYAIGHWLQKATEHVIGCVLCSPGCFSLFRGSALMEDNVMKRYTTESSEARHYVQYDQGEDRWLCTLLLQRGFRVEYSAASDAYTHCPEGFNEFYNQRRRWMPSTTANILDLLTDFKYITHTNQNISMLYITYQGVMMIGTVLGPGTIFLMLVGAFVAAFQMDQWTSFMYNAAPILIFMTVCKLFSSSDVQLFFAGLLSAIYGLVMMAVLVGVLMQIQQDGIMSPSSLFFFFIAGEFIITAMMHPKEFGCLMYGVIYYVTVPSMYLLLVIYSVFNMNNVSWGTRETVVVAPTEGDDKAKAKAVPENGATRVLNLLGANGQERTGAISFSIANLFKCLLCTAPSSPEEERLKAIQTTLDAIQVKLGMIEKQAEQVTEEQPLASAPPPEEDESTNSVTAEEYEDLNWWMDENDTMKKCETGMLTEEERVFWLELVEKYLKPEDKSDKEKQQISKDLGDLRDKSVAAFFMINALFVIVVFLLTLKKDLLHIDWPFNVKTNFTYHADTMQIMMQKEYLELEPIGFVFLIFFGILMVVQFTAMFQHRFETMCQILANMEFNLSWFHNTTEEIVDESIVRKGKRFIDGVKELQRLKGDDDDEDSVPKGQRRTTLMNNAAIHRKLRNAKSTLLEAYTERLKKVQGKPVEEDERRRGKGAVATANEIARRVTIVERRKTRMTQMRMTRMQPPTNEEGGGYHNRGFEHFADSFN